MRTPRTPNHTLDFLATLVGLSDPCLAFGSSAGPLHCSEKLPAHIQYASFYLRLPALDRLHHVKIFKKTKILIKLAVEEPGANWGNEFYTHSRGTPSISGWLLPESWTREDEEMRGEGGPRRTGVLGLRYITDAVRGLWCSILPEPEKGPGPSPSTTLYSASGL